MASNASLGEVFFGCAPGLLSWPPGLPDRWRSWPPSWVVPRRESARWLFARREVWGLACQARRSVWGTAAGFSDSPGARTATALRRAFSGLFRPAAIRVERPWRRFDGWPLKMPGVGWISRPCSAKPYQATWWDRGRARKRRIACSPRCWHRETDLETLPPSGDTPPAGKCSDPHRWRRGQLVSDGDLSVAGPSTTSSWPFVPPRGRLASWKIARRRRRWQAGRRLFAVEVRVKIAVSGRSQPASKSSYSSLEKIGHLCHDSIKH